MRIYKKLSKTSASEAFKAALAANYADKGNPFLTKADIGLINPYKSYVAIITQSGTDAPVAEVKNNSLGYDITFTRSNVGSYYINQEAVNDLWVSVSKLGAYEGDFDLSFTKGDTGLGFVILTSVGMVLTDGFLSICVEFRKYG